MDVFISSRFASDFEQQPIVLIDIGASGGLQPHWEPAKQHLRVIGFEPDKREFSRLAGEAPPWIRYFNTALADKPGPVQFHLARRQMTSSIYLPNLELLKRFPDYKDYEVVETVEVEADTLDNVLKEANVRNVDFAKIDTQGSELAILKGGERLVRSSVFGLELEVEFLSIYQGQPLFAEVDEYVRSLGFELFDLRPFHWKRSIGKDLGGPTGQLAFGDALYFKSAAALSEMLAGLPDPDLRRQKVLRAVSITLLYGYLDYALELFQGQTELFDKTDNEVFLAELQKFQRLINKLPDFRGRWRLADVLYRLSQAIDPTNTGWSIGGRKLGNMDK